MNEKESVILILISQSEAQSWNKVLSQGIPGFLSVSQAEELLSSFISALGSLSRKVFLGVEKENPFTKTLRKRIQELNTASEEWPYQAELGLLQKIWQKNASSPVALIRGVYPLLNKELFLEIESLQARYQPDVTLTENIPAGLAPVFFGPSLIQSFTDESDEIPESLPLPLETYIEKHIAKFHAEIFYDVPDLRMLRLDFSCMTLRSFVVTARVLQKKPSASKILASLQDLMKGYPEILYVWPSWIELELISDCEYQCDFCPRQFVEIPSARLSITDIEKILEQLSEGLDDTAVCLGGMGEPLQHPDAAKIMELLLDHPSVKQLVLETNAYHLDSIMSLAEHEHNEKLKLIWNVNSLREYDKIHGAPKGAWEKVEANIETWLKKVDPSCRQNVYLQALKIIENEKELDSLYAYCEKRGIVFLLQKYNSYIGLMPERRVSDLTPFERSFCWHLRRDMFIRANGSVSFCKQDVRSKKARGNIREKTIRQIWEAGLPDWQNNYLEKYPVEPACARCDEYYTFNL